MATSTTDAIGQTISNGDIVGFRASASWFPDGTKPPYTLRGIVRGCSKKSALVEFSWQGKTYSARVNTAKVVGTNRTERGDSTITPN